MRVIRVLICAICAVLPWAASAQAPPVDVTTGHMAFLPRADTGGSLPLVPLARPDRDTPPPDPISDLAPADSLRPVPRDSWPVPTLRWDDHPRASIWTAALMAALRSHGAPLMDVVPGDIDQWCPGYPQADRAQRAAFWAGLVSTLAWHESTHRPRAVGGGGRWFGLVQIAPGTARYRNCAVRTGEALLNGPANLSCGVRIMAITVPRDGVISQGMRGVAADWGPFHSRRKREDMRTWVRSQDYCALPPAAVSSDWRPVPRPALTAMTGPALPVTQREPVQRPVLAAR
jgi:hypothetical protein